MHADDPLRLGHPGCDRGHREGGGVRGQDGFRATHLGQLGEQLLLEREILRRGLDHQLAAGQVLESRGRSQKVSGALGFLAAPSPSLDPLFEGGAQPLHSGGQRLGDRIVQPRLEAPQAGDLSDAGAHRAGADDADALDPQRSSSNTFAIATSP
ncbi:MAG: hypothetical protein AABM43_11345 [Actinomycetota bacterium]